MKNLKNKKPNNNEIQPKEKQDESPYYDNISATDLGRFSSAYKNKNNPIQTPPQVYATAPVNLQPSTLQLKLQLLLKESQQREQAYQNYIKKKHQQSYEMTQNYLKNLQKYKQELDKYVGQKNKKKQAKHLHYKANAVLNGQLTKFSMVNKKKLEVYYPLAFTGKENPNETGHKVNLKCTIGLKSFTPLVQDYLKEKFPTHLSLQIRLPIKQKFLINNQKSQTTLQVTVKMDQDESENIDNLIHGYPFRMLASGNRNGRQVAPSQGQSMKYEFTILNEQQNIDYLQKGKVWINVYDRDSQMLWAYSSFAADQLLHYHKESTITRPLSTEQVEVIECYSPYNHKRNCLFQFRIEIEPCYMEESSNRVESNEPMELARIHMDRNVYGDKQSRLIQRINKFKSAATSLIMRPDAHYMNKQADKAEFFKNTNDKTLIEHRKRKEIESINKFKEEHKPQLMEKLFDEALQKYSLQDIELGSPKYLPFYFQKPESSHQRIHTTISLKISSHPNHEEELRNQIHSQLIGKQLAQTLLQKNMIRLKENASTDIQVIATDKQSNTIDVYDSKVVLMVKVLIFPTLHVEGILAQEGDKLRCDICLKVQSEDGEVLSEQVFKLRPVLMRAEYEMSLHNYEMESQKVSLPLNIAAYQQDPFYEAMLHSVQIIASVDVSCELSTAMDMLDVTVKFPTVKMPIENRPAKNLREVQITLLDGASNFVFYSFRIKLFSYRRMKQVPQYLIGSVCRYNFTLQFDEETNIPQLGMEKSLTKKAKSALVGFYSSHPNESTVFCQDKQEIMVEDNRTYPIEVNYQSFSMERDEDRVLIHMVDLNSNEVLKKWLLRIKKTFEDYRSINQVKVQRKKPLKYSYLLKNTSNTECSFKLFSSNYSIIQVPLQPVRLFDNQQSKVEIDIMVVKDDLTVEQRQKGIHVILRIEPSNGPLKGWNELFRVIVG